MPFFQKINNLHRCSKVAIEVCGDFRGFSGNQIMLTAGRFTEILSDVPVQNSLGGDPRPRAAPEGPQRTQHGAGDVARAPRPCVVNGRDGRATIHGPCPGSSQEGLPCPACLKESGEVRKEIIERVLTRRLGHRLDLKRSD